MVNQTVGQRPATRRRPEREGRGRRTDGRAYPAMAAVHRRRRGGFQGGWTAEAPGPAGARGCRPGPAPERGALPMDRSVQRSGRCSPTASRSPPGWSRARPKERSGSTQLLSHPQEPGIRSRRVAGKRTGERTGSPVRFWRSTPSRPGIAPGRRTMECRGRGSSSARRAASMCGGTASCD